MSMSIMMDANLYSIRSWIICGKSCLLDSHLSTYVNLNLPMLDSHFLCSLFMDVCKFWMASLCVVEGALANQYKSVCHVYVGGWVFLFVCFFLLPFLYPLTFVDVSASTSLPNFQVCDLILCMVIYCSVQYIWWTMVVISSVSRSWCWDDGCLI